MVSFWVLFKCTQTKKLTPNTADSEGDGFVGKYELRLATGEIIVSRNDGFSESSVSTSFSLPYDESSISTTTSEVKEVEAPCMPCPYGAVDGSVLVLLPGEEVFYTCDSELEYMYSFEEDDDVCDYQYPFVQKFCCPSDTVSNVPTLPSDSPAPLPPSSDMPTRPSDSPAPLPTYAPSPTSSEVPTSSDVPTLSPPSGYVGRGWCLDAQGVEYQSIIDDGSTEIRSSHDCLDLCETIPVSDPSDLVGFVHDSKPLNGPTCGCLYTTLPDVTFELGNELGIRPYFLGGGYGAGPVAGSNNKDDSISCFSTSPVSSIF